MAGSGIHWGYAHPQPQDVGKAAAALRWYLSTQSSPAQSPKGVKKHPCKPSKANIKARIEHGVG